MTPLAMLIVVGVTFAVSLAAIHVLERLDAHRDRKAARR